jgi:ankyrin repeat protein
MLDLIEIPLKQHKNFTINLQINNIDKRVIDNDVYFFVRPTNLYCGKIKEYRDAKDIKTPESNETLKPLYNALQNSNITDLKNFFQTTKLPYNVTMQGNRTALHYAAYFNNANATAYLLSHNKSMIDLRDISNKTALSYVVEYGCVEATKELVKYKPDFEVVIGDRLFGSAGILKRLYNAVESNKDSYTRMMIEKDTYDENNMLELFLEAGLNPNILINFGGRIDDPYMTTLLTSASSDQNTYDTQQRLIAIGKTKESNTHKNFSSFIEILKKYDAKTRKELQGELTSSNNNTTTNSQGE